GVQRPQEAPGEEPRHARRPRRRLLLAEGPQRKAALARIEPGDQLRRPEAVDAAELAREIEKSRSRSEVIHALVAAFDHLYRAIQQPESVAFGDRTPRPDQRAPFRRGVHARERTTSAA